MSRDTRNGGESSLGNERPDEPLLEEEGVWRKGTLGRGEAL